MIGGQLYPLRFEPIFQYRLWGGWRLGAWLDTPLPDGPVGEAWILSDRKDHASKVAEGALKGQTLTDLMKQFEGEIMGDLAGKFQRFPLLLKFLDVRQMLSVQVHPRDDQRNLILEGESGKTEAWVVLEAGLESRIYAGLKLGTDAGDLRTLTAENADKYLASFRPEVGQGVMIEAGSVHSLGNGVMVFEVQENSDVTFRLYDWDHVDDKTGKPRDLQVDKALACIDFNQGAIRPSPPPRKNDAQVARETYFDNGHFHVDRIVGNSPFDVGIAAAPGIVVCVQGKGHIEHDGADFAMDRGAVIIIPASIGGCRFRPSSLATILEIAIPYPAEGLG